MVWVIGDGVWSGKIARSLMTEEDLSNTTIRRFDITRLIARGGMGGGLSRQRRRARPRSRAQDPLARASRAIRIVSSDSCWRREPRPH